MLLISQYQNMGGARSVRLPRKGEQHVILKVMLRGKI